MARLKFNLIQRCIAGATLAALSASAASATIFPPVTVDGVYQQTTSTGTTSPPDGSGCFNLFCFFVFSRVPIGKQLVVTNVSCTFTVTAGDIMTALLFPQLPNGDFLIQNQYLQPARTVGHRFVLNGTTLAPFRARQSPLLEIKTSDTADISGTCTIAGRMTDAPP